MLNFRPFAFDVRFTRESGPNPLTYHPMGYVNNMQNQFDRKEIIAGYGPMDYFSIQIVNDGPWYSILSADGSFMYKLLLPKEIADEYETHRFVYNGIWYVLDIRILYWND